MRTKKREKPISNLLIKNLRMSLRVEIYGAVENFKATFEHQSITIEREDLKNYCQQRERGE